MKNNSNNNNSNKLYLIYQIIKYQLFYIILLSQILLENSYFYYLNNYLNNILFNELVDLHKLIQIKVENIYIYIYYINSKYITKEKQKKIMKKNWNNKEKDKKS